MGSFPIGIIARQDWMGRARLCRDTRLESVFRYLPDFYFGPASADNPDIIFDPMDRLRLPHLSFNPDEAEWIPARQLDGQTDEFAQYYRDLVDIAYAHHKSFDDIRHFFNVQSFIVSETAQVTISIPWRGPDGQDGPLYRWIKAGIDKSEFIDAEPGWQIRGAIKHGKVYLLQTDSNFDGTPASTAYYDCVEFDLRSLQNMIVHHNKLLESIIAKLAAKLGCDVWTAYTQEDAVHFGTHDWTPKSSRLQA